MYVGNLKAKSDIKILQILKTIMFCNDAASPTAAANQNPGRDGAPNRPLAFPVASRPISAADGRARQATAFHCSAVANR